jgi:coatomer protein complex subunit gamma
MKQIATFVSEISDEFKVVVVQAIKSLALKFPRKHGILMNFLSSMLRDEGGLVRSWQNCPANQKYPMQG